VCDAVWVPHFGDGHPLADWPVRGQTTAPIQSAVRLVQVVTTMLSSMQADTNASYPMGRIATAEEVGEAVTWLLQNRGSGFMTGQTLVLDGGASA